MKTLQVLVFIVALPFLIVCTITYGALVPLMKLDDWLAKRSREDEIGEIFS